MKYRDPYRVDEDDETHGVDVQAAEAYVRCRQGPWTVADQEVLERRLANDAGFAEAFHLAGDLWQSVGIHAVTTEMMGLREGAIGRARRGGGRRRAATAGWRMAVAAAGIGVVLGLSVWFVPRGDRASAYRTGIGEQRVLELDDHSRIALDAATSVRVNYSDDVRLVELEEGQAQFSVAKDPARPFKVRVGGRTVVALGTVFTVEYIDQRMQVSMLEGRVAVLPPPALDMQARTDLRDPADAIRAQVQGGMPGAGIELGVGETLRISPNGLISVDERADLEAITSWRRGKIVLDGVPLGEAIRRINRYSRLQLEIDDPMLAALRVSGVFEIGDTRAFAEATQAYLPVVADYSDRDTVRLVSRR